MVLCAPGHMASGAVASPSSPVALVQPPFPVGPPSAWALGPAGCRNSASDAHPSWHRDSLPVVCPRESQGLLQIASLLASPLSTLHASFRRSAGVPSRLRDSRKDTGWHTVPWDLLEVRLMRRGAKVLGGLERSPENKL